MYHKDTSSGHYLTQKSVHIFLQLMVRGLLSVSEKNEQIYHKVENLKGISAQIFFLFHPIIGK